jgi:peroxiredoxin
MAIAVNTKAPLFTLKRWTGGGFEEVSLADNFGKSKTVLIFVPAAFSSICQDELCSISGGLDQYKDLGAIVWGISVDNPFALAAWENIAGIGFPVLSDLNKEVIAAYDIVCDDFIGYKGVAKRSAFVVDEAGTVIYSWSSDDARVLPPFDEVKAVL